MAVHLVGVPNVVTHHLETLVRNVLRDRCDEITRREQLRVAILISTLSARIAPATCELLCIQLLMFSPAM